MKKLLATLGIVALAILLCAPAALADDGPTFKVTDLTTHATLTPYDPLAPARGELYVVELRVGETRTFEIEITSREPFIFAAAMPDAYYPGRAVFFHGRDQVTKDTYAVLHLTVTGKRSTAGLAPVCGWYADACLDGGIAPLAIVAGARYKGGLAVGQFFPFSVVVTE